MENLLSYKNKWFVVHHKTLLYENPNLIGFRDRNEWELISKGDLIVYYQTGYRRIKGFFEIKSKGINIDPDFGRRNFAKGELQHQHELKLVYSFDFPFDQSMASNLTFYSRLRNPIRWDNKRVFPITNNDVSYILSL